MAEEKNKKADNQEENLEEKIEETSGEESDFGTSAVEEEKKNDVSPEEIDGRLYVPVSFVKRYIASTMTVDRNLKDVEFDNGRLKFDLKGREATSYGYPVTFIGNAYIMNGTIMVPIRTVAGVYSYSIRYNGYSRIVELYQ